MLYALLIYGLENEWRAMNRDDRQRRMDAHIRAFQREMDDGTFVAAARLMPTETATTVRGAPSRPIVVDGPFAESREQLGGFQLVDCENLDRAIEYAKLLADRGGTVEIRPVHPDPGAID